MQAECQELKAEVDNLKMELENDERAESGNSLFAEVTNIFLFPQDICMFVRWRTKG